MIYKNSILTKLLSLILLVTFTFTLLPSALVFAETDYEFVLTADKDSVAEGEEVKFTVTLNGSMKDLSMVQYRLQYDPDKFTMAVNLSDPFAAMDSQWYNVWATEIYKIGFTSVYDGLFEIDMPTTGPKTDEDDASKSVYTVLYLNQSGRKVTSKSSIYNSTSVVAGVLIFTATEDIESIADEIVLKDVKIQVTPDDGKVTDKTTSAVQLKKEISEEAASAIDAISKIGTVAYTDACKALIDDAKAKYDLVEDKAEVENEKVLTDAIATYDSLKKAKVDAAKAAIEAIGEVKYNTTSKNLIDTAQNAYDALLEADKAEVDAADLLAAQQRYEELETEINGLVDTAIAQIDALPETIKLSDEAQVQSAETSYLAIPEDYRIFVGNYSKLEDALETIETLKQEIEDIKAAIDNLPDDITLEDKADVLSVKDDFDALTDEQKELVTNKAALELALETIAKLVADVEAAEAFDTLVDALPNDITIEDEAKITEARAAYTALTNAQKALTKNLSKLEQAEAALVKIKEDTAAAKAVEDMIADLGEITLEDDASIKAAREAYDDLTDDQKALVENLEVLTDAEDKIEELKAAADKEELDRAAALGVDNKISALPENLTIDDEALVKAARDAYEVLTDDQKAYVANLDALVAAEDAIQKIKDDMAAAKIVDDAIDALGEITLDDEEAVEDAREAYELLTDDQKAYVEKLAILEAAELALEAIKADIAAAEAVDELILAIGEVEYTAECKALIDAARSAYSVLTEKQRELVTNYNTLVEAEARYLELAPSVLQTEEPVAEYGNVYVTVFKDIEEGKKVVLGSETAIMVKLADKVYYIVVDDEKVDTNTAIVTDEATEETKLGDITGDGEITSNDAYAANKKAADLEVEQFNNKYMYVIADVDGDKDITARDAYMISKLSAGEIDSSIFTFVTGK